MKVGISSINHQTQTGPNAVSNRKNNPTSEAEINLGANVIKINENPTVNIIRNIYDKSTPPITKLVKSIDEIKAVINLPITYEGIKFLSAADLITTRLLATETAVNIPKISPKILPEPIES